MPPNSKISPELEVIIDNQFQKDIDLGRLAGPFRVEDVIQAVGGPIRSSPVNVVSKSVPIGHPPKWRVTDHHSYPVVINKQGIASLNSLIDASDFPCRWALISDYEELFRALPPGALAMSFDIVDAFNTLGLHPTVRYLFCVRRYGFVFIRKVASFGTRSTPGVFGNVIDFMVDGMEFIFGRNIIVRNTVDDVLVVRLDHSITREMVLELPLRLGWNIHDLSVKGSDWATVIEQAGIIWDIVNLTKTIPEKKRIKYLAYLDECLAMKGRTLDLERIQRLTGYLVYVTMVIPNWRTFLARLYAFRTSYNNNDNRFDKKHLPRNVRSDLRKWQIFLSTPNISSSFRIPPQQSTLYFASDASNLGIGVVVGSYARFSPFEPSWRTDLRADIGPAEAWGVESLLEAAVAFGLRDCRVTIWCDNEGVNYSWVKGYSRSRLTNRAIFRMNELATVHGLTVRLEYIKSAENPADAVSRNETPSKYLSFPSKLVLRHPRGTIGGGAP